MSMTQKQRSSRGEFKAVQKILKRWAFTRPPRLTDAQRRVQDLIENSLSTLRVHSALNTNAKIIASTLS